MDFEWILMHFDSSTSCVRCPEVAAKHASREAIEDVSEAMLFALNCKIRVPSHKKTLLNMDGVLGAMLATSLTLPKRTLYHECKQWRQRKRAVEAMWKGDLNIQ